MKRARGCFSLFVCFLNEFVLTLNSSPLDVQNLSFPTQRSNLHLVIKALCKPRQAWAHFTLLTAEKLLRNHLGAGHAPSEREGRDAPDEFKYLSIGYKEVPQKTYFSLKGNKNIGKKKIKLIVSPCPSMHQHLLSAAHTLLGDVVRGHMPQEKENQALPHPNQPCCVQSIAKNSGFEKQAIATPRQWGDGVPHRTAFSRYRQHTVGYAALGAWLPKAPSWNIQQPPREHQEGY